VSYKAYTYCPTGLRCARLMQAVCGRVTPFRGLFALLFVLLEARDVLVREKEAIARERRGAEKLEEGFAKGYGL
jgi:hypothetical protein